ncbi:MAG: acetoacetate decarboxylase family protein [Candidatus Krumholzibacteria bacterium]|nr:acetoacetate decarboxylase family protein [Candidatus Krumholzibacteria bacterium]
MPLTKYHFRMAVSAFFEMSTEGARNILPRHLQPLEVRHGRSIFAVTAFDFTDSMVGSYQEIVLAVIVPPLVKPGTTLPRSAFYPFLVGTSTAQAREHAIERWHLPHHMADIAVEFDESDAKVRMQVRESAKPILDFLVNAHDWSDVDHLYQSFMIATDDKFKVDIHMRGTFTEHEEETGEIHLHDHPMCEKLLDADVESYPFRELWMKHGVQLFEELETL